MSTSPFTASRPAQREGSGRDPSFHRELEDPQAAVSIDMGSDSRRLLIAFGGMVGRIGMPPFEFFSLTGSLPVKRLFVRDLLQAWYHGGIHEHGGTIIDVAGYLGELIAGQDVDRVVVTGNSAGGYAALLFGTLLGAETVLCFAPQTVLDLDVLTTVDDHRWDDRLRRLGAEGVLDPRWTDLRNALPCARRADTRCHIYFDETFRADRLHAERLAGIEGVRLHRLSAGRHSIARTLRESGALALVLRRALDGSLASAEGPFDASLPRLRGHPTGRGARR
jgi:hypothetical protein